MSALAQPITISGDAGDWRLHHSGRIYRAEFHPLRDAALFWSASAASSWQLEAMIGAPLPAELHDYLARNVTTTDHVWVDAERPAPAVTEPSAFHVVGLGDARGFYGAMLARAPVLASWADDSYRLDLARAGERADGRVVIAHRLWHQGRLMHASPSLLVEPGRRPDVNRLLRSALDWIRLYAGDTPRFERAWLLQHTDALTARTALPEHPYPAGTRVVVDVGNCRARAGGVVATEDRAGHPAGYAWRPAAYDLVGHPWRDKPHQLVVSARHDVHAALVIPAELDARAAYGARVTVIGVPAAPTGTILRVMPLETGAVNYEIQPDNPALPARWFGESELEVTAPTAWPTVAHLVAARVAAGHPLMAGELLTAMWDARRVVVDAAGRLSFGAAARMPSTDPLLDPDAYQPFARLDIPSVSLDRPRPPALPGV